MTQLLHIYEVFAQQRCRDTAGGMGPANIEGIIMKKLLLATAALFAASSANAAYVYVGSWDVFNDDAEQWTCCAPNGPLAYTGLEAAALIFGGSPGDYAVSTVSDQVADIDFQAWYDVIGVGGRVKAQDYFSKYLGLYYGPTTGFGTNEDNAASTYIRDNLFGGGSINYAFRWDDSVVPEPATWGLMIAGFGLVGFAARRRRDVATA